MTLDQLIQRVLDDTDYAASPFFRALAGGTFARAAFVETQVQFLHAVVFFSRPMAAVAARIPDPALRVEILRNVWEEHGEGDPARFHETTFREFLARLAGLDAAAIDARPLWPCVRAFNTTLAGAGVLDDYLVSVCVMGAIERMFSEISGVIGRAVVDAGWLAAERMIHYNLHEALDVRHANDFFDVVRPAWERDPAARYPIEQGLRLGAYAFKTLYDGLYAAAQKSAPERRSSGC